MADLRVMAGRRDGDFKIVRAVLTVTPLPRLRHKRMLQSKDDLPFSGRVRSSICD